MVKKAHELNANAQYYALFSSPTTTWYTLECM